METVAPQPPVMVSPQPGDAVNPRAVPFRWEAAERATGYELQIARDEAFTEIIFDVNLSEVLSFTADVLRTGVNYYWRIRAHDERQWGPYSAPQPFLTSGDKVEAIPERTAEEIGVENEGIQAGAILTFMFVMAIIIGIAVTIVFNLTNLVAQDVYDTAATEMTYPEAREARAGAAAQLNQYEVLDQEQGVYQIPVDRAMELMLNEAYQRQADTTAVGSN